MKSSGYMLLLRGYLSLANSMDQKKLLELFESLSNVGLCAYPTGSTYMNGEPETEYSMDEAMLWTTKAHAALEAALPQGHAVLRRFEAVLGKGPPVTDKNTFDALVAIFNAANALLQGGYLSSFLDGIRADAEGEILEQAEQLLASGHLIAATVLGGGALETHLLGLCKRHGIQWSGDGSIAKYARLLLSGNF